MQYNCPSIDATTRRYSICSASLTSITPAPVLDQNRFPSHSSPINFGPAVSYKLVQHSYRDERPARACLHMVWAFDDMRLFVYLERLHSHSYSILRDPFIY